MEAADQFGEAMQIGDEQAIDVESATVDEELGEAVSETAQHVLCVALENVGDRHAVVDGCGFGCEDFGEQVLLAGEMGVEGRLGDARRPGDVVHRHRCVAGLGEQPLAGVQHLDGLAGGLGRRHWQNLDLLMN